MRNHHCDAKCFVKVSNYQRFIKRHDDINDYTKSKFCKFRSCLLSLSLAFDKMSFKTLNPYGQ